MKTMSETSSGSSQFPDVLVAPFHRWRSRTPRERDGRGGRRVPVQEEREPVVPGVCDAARGSPPPSVGELEAP